MRDHVASLNFASLPFGHDLNLTTIGEDYNTEISKFRALPFNLTQLSAFLYLTICSLQVKSVIMFVCDVTLQ